MYLYPTAYKALSVAALTTVTGLAHAGGFALIEHGASGLGNAYAGSAALAGDTSTVWFNPAGMLNLSKREVSGGLHLIATDTSIADQGTTANTALGGFPIEGGATGSNSGTTVVPNFYYVAPINDKMAYGVGIDVPFGSSSDYGSTWRGRYTATESALRVIDINPSFAYRVSNKVQLGAGISLQQMSATLANSVDSGAVCFGGAALQAQGIIANGGTAAEAQAQLTASEAACTNLGLTPGNVETDSSVKIEGDSTAVGFNLGAMFSPAENTRLGVAYRHSVKHKLDGTATFSNSAPLQTILDLTQSPRFRTGPGGTEVTTPASLSASVAHTLAKYNKWQLLADVSWTQWSSFEELRITFDNPAQDDVVQVQDWNDAVRVAAGFNYQHSPRLVLRAGLAFDQSPIPGPDRRTPRIPGNDRTWFSVGMGYRQSKNLSFDVGFTHIAVDETPIDNSFPESGPSAPHLRGLIDSDVNILSAQLNWKFN